MIEHGDVVYILQNLMCRCEKLENEDQSLDSKYALSFVLLNFTYLQMMVDADFWTNQVAALSSLTSGPQQHRRNDLGEVRWKEMVKDGKSSKINIDNH